MPAGTSPFRSIHQIGFVNSSTRSDLRKSTGSVKFVFKITNVKSTSLFAQNCGANLSIVYQAMTCECKGFEMNVKKVD